MLMAAVELELKSRTRPRHNTRPKDWHFRTHTLHSVIRTLCGS